MKGKKFLALMMAAAMTMSLASCGDNSGDESGNTGNTENAGDSGNTGSNESESSSEPESQSGGETNADTRYIYKDAVSLLASNWSVHTYRTADDGYPVDYIASGFYDFVYNDEYHPVEGMDPFTGYTIVPLMAASDPVDVTEKIKAEHPEYGIPESATAGFAYTIDLNPNAVWEDGTVINADSYVYSMQQLLDPKMKNYRATDYFDGDFIIAGAKAYNYAGRDAFYEAAAAVESMDDLTVGDDGFYTLPDGSAVYVALTDGLEWLGGNTLTDYVNAYGEAYFGVEDFNALQGMADENGHVQLNEETLAHIVGVITTVADWGESAADAVNYLVYGVPFPECDYDSTVGLFKSGEYQITIVLENSLSGFNLYYNLAGPTWLVKEDIYESCKRFDGDAFTSTYCTSVETTSSYGPYKMTEFQSDKAMHFVRNENWVGYADGQHTYVDPTDGETYDMYMTDEIDTQVVSESSTSKLMFLKGELMGYGLQAEDFDTYRNSEYAYATPRTTTFFFIFNGYLDAIKEREANDGFDQTKNDLETMTLQSFRRAVAVTYDKELFASTISPARKGGYGLIGSAYVYDPDTGAKYRDTDQAKQVLCDFYSVNTAEYSNLDEAVASITGYDPEAAKELYTQAFNEALEKGFITDNDGDGISDQSISIEYAMGDDPNDFMTKTINYLNEKMADVTTGTPFEGKIQFVMSANYGNDWDKKLKAGMSDTVLAGWQGSLLNPFSIIRLYTNGTDQQYDYQWFDASKINLTLELEGESITMNLRQWSEALLGSTVKVGENEYNFGEADADVDTRLTILAALEGQILQTYDYIPMLEDASMALLSQQVFYVVDDYSPIMGRGGIAYMKYNYNESEWAAYVAEQGGELKY
ncbi:MAG: hypothetical protein K2J60_05325 [Acetatifactor sp.]|nr:hypothetical protein [Acetatifactor sp.]